MQITERLPRETGRDYALRTLKKNIVSLDLAPGSSISENEIAAELGLSRTPVREAFLELAKVRIIETQPQKKSMVAMIDYNLIEEAQFMRNVLEPAVAELCCEMAKEEDIRLLQENVRMQEIYLDTFYPERMMELDDAFHEMLFSIAHKPQVYRQIQHISIHFDRVRNMALYSVKSTKIVNDHKEIVQAIMDKDPARARAVMEEHLGRYRMDASVLKEKYPQYFV